MVDPNLLRITKTNIETRINIKNGELKNRNDPEPLIKGKVQPGEFEISMELPYVRIDSYEATSSLGYGHYNVMDLNLRNSEKSAQAADEGTRRSVREGNQMAEGAKTSDIIKQHNRVGYNIQTVTEFLPKLDGVDISLDEGELDINIGKNEVETEWENLEVSKLMFIPGSVEIEVLQKPSVDVEYVGRPIYFPKSADPDVKYSLDTTV